MKLVSDRLENTLEIKRLNKRCLHKVAHNRQEQPYESSKAISDRWWQGNCKKCKKMGKYDVQEKRKTTMKGTGWEERGKETTDVGTTLARRARGGWGKASPEPRGAGSPAETLGRAGTCTFCNYSLVTTSVKFFEMHTWCPGNRAKPFRMGECLLCPSQGWPASFSSSLPLQKGAQQQGPQQPRQKNVLFHMCADLCLKMKARAYLRNWSSPGILWSNRFLVLWKWGFKPC